MDSLAAGSQIVDMRREDGDGDVAVGAGDPSLNQSTLLQQEPSQFEDPMEEISICLNSVEEETKSKSPQVKSKWKSLARFKSSGKKCEPDGGKKEGSDTQEVDEPEAGDQSKSIPLTKKSSISRMLSRVSQSTHKLLHFRRSQSDEEGSSSTAGMEPGSTSTLGRLFSLKKGRRCDGGEGCPSRSSTLPRRSSGTLVSSATTPSGE